MVVGLEYKMNKLHRHHDQFVNQLKSKSKTNMLYYATHFDEYCNALYSYSIKTGRRKLGIIPAGISMTFRNYQLDTIKVMQQLQSLFTTNRLPNNLISLNAPHDWYDGKNKFNSAQMYRLQKALDKLQLAEN